MSSETKDHSSENEEIVIKDSRDTVFRRKYDFWPSFYQHSLSSKEDVVEARKCDFKTREAFASQCKQRGNDCFVTGEFNNAISEYERALSMFCWVEPLNPTWRREEVEDEKLRECSYVTENIDEKKIMTALQVSCYLNLAACYQKTKDWANSFEACNYAITIDSSSGRAYFRRAQARILPAVTGSVGDEELLALCDLKVAHQLAPDNQEIARTYINLSLAIDEHRRKEKELFKKAFKKTEESKKREDTGDCVSVKPKTSKVKGHKSKNGEYKKVAGKVTPEERVEGVLPVESRGSVNGSGGWNVGGSVVEAIVKPTQVLGPGATAEKSSEKPTAATAQASLKAALLTIEEAINRIKEVEDRAAELSKEGRHAEALILSDKAKTAKLHIESMHIQQAKAEKIQREYFGGGELTEHDSSNETDGSDKELRLRGNLFAVDFLNPSPSIIEDARAQGLDLTDKRARRIMYELQKEAGISKTRALQWVQTGTPKENPEGKDDFVARVIDRVYREESRELAGKLVDGLSRGVLLGMLRSRRLSPPVDMGDSSYYALTADAKQLAAVVIAGAGAGVLTGLSTYELALANAKQERKTLIARARDGLIMNSEAVSRGQSPGVNPSGALALQSDPVTAPGSGSGSGSGTSVGTCVGGSVGMGEALDPIISSDCGSTSTFATVPIGKDGSVEDTGVNIAEKEIEEMEGEKEKAREEAEAAKKVAEAKEKEEKELELQRERENEGPLEDMSKDELKERILPFLAGDLFLIWRETDLATEKEKLRMRNKLLHIEDDVEIVSEEVKVERLRLDAMSLEQRGEYEKDKREEVVYTMLQNKYGLDEEKITDDAERLRASSKANIEHLRSLRQDSSSPYYGMIMGAITFITLLAMYTFFT